MAIMTTVLKIAVIPCMLAFIFLMLMIMGFIPSNRIIEVLKKHKAAQAMFAIMIGIGVLSSFFIVTS